MISPNETKSLYQVFLKKKVIMKYDKSPYVIFNGQKDGVVGAYLRLSSNDDFQDDILQITPSGIYLNSLRYKSIIKELEVWFQCNIKPDCNGNYYFNFTEEQNTIFLETYFPFYLSYKEILHIERELSCVSRTKLQSGYWSDIKKEDIARFDSLAIRYNQLLEDFDYNILLNREKFRKNNHELC